MKAKKKLYIQQKKRYLSNIFGTNNKPRLSIFRSNSHIYSQIIDDLNGFTLCSFSTLEFKKSLGISFKVTKKNYASLVGKIIANKAKLLGINTVTFDRGKKEYKGRIKSLAEGARSEHLKF
jgi:large subunit ribosomal protein L18